MQFEISNFFDDNKSTGKLFVDFKSSENETCSGNGICKVITSKDIIPHQTNESIECKCFGIDQFKGKSCEIKTIKYIVRQITVKTTYYVAIIVLIAFYLLIFSSDLINFFIKKDVLKGKRTRKNKKTKKSNLFQKFDNS